MEISKFKNIFESSNGSVTSVDEFLNQVKFGTWRSEAKTINSISDKKLRNKEKQKIPYVTISGLFNHRKASELVQHSGFICLDFDDLEDIDGAINRITQDQFVYACFKSISGKGLAVIVKIDPKRHLDAFLGLEVYFANKHQIYVDRSCKDVSRARFASFDPNLYTNPDSNKFANYIPKSEKVAKSKLPNVITGKNDMDYIINQINQNSIDITKSSYATWLEIGFALSEEFNESGREFYHAVSYYSDKYDSKRCDKQFDHCIKAGGNGINFATFLYHAKASGISIISPETKHIITASVIAKNAGRGARDIIKTLKDVDGYDESVTRDIVEKVMSRDDIGDNNKLPRIDALEIFINSNYSLKKNEITRAVENYGEEIDDTFLNSSYIKARKEVDDKVRFEELDKLIRSDFVDEYNPLREFFERNAHITPEGEIKKLCDSIISKNEYKELFMTKWLVGIIESVFGGHSPLCLVLTGGQNTGKTYWFRHLLPEDIRSYYAESKLDAGKDDEILMTQKIIIMDDEFGGKSKKEATRMKEVTSKEYFTLREPYGRKNVRLKRLAVLAGTSNDQKILNDPTGNRRIIPIKVDGINREIYNSIDKTELFMEVYHLWKSGYTYKTNKEEIEILNEATTLFNQVVIERELIIRYFKTPEMANNSDPTGIEYLQLTEIKSEIEKKTLQKVNQFKLSQSMGSLGFEEVQQDVNGNVTTVFPVIRVPDEAVSERGDEKVIKLDPFGKTGDVPF